MNQRHEVMILVILALVQTFEPKHLLHHAVDEVCFSWQPLTISLYSIEKENVKNAFCKEPVPEMLTKACYGLIDAPSVGASRHSIRTHATAGLASCRHEPCLMTWHVRVRKTIQSLNA